MTASSAAAAVTDSTPSAPRVSPVAPGLRPRVARAVQLAKMVAYFGLLLLGAKILQEILLEISNTEYMAELSRVSGMAASILDVNKNVDDLTITLFALTITFLLSLPVAWVHTLTKGDTPEPSLTQTLIMLSVIVAGVMLLLEDNLARSFSLVGVVAAVRYRNTLKDPKDAVFVFLSLGIGMAGGLQAYHVALLLSMFECAILLVLWMFQTGAPAMGETSLFSALKEREKKGERSPAEAMAWLTPEARGRVEAELEQQSRYINLAAMVAGQSGKRPNCVVVVETDGSADARDAINTELEEHRGRWRLLGANDSGGVSTLEFLGRVPKKRSPPLKLLERLRHAAPGVRHVEFRSLRKMIADKADPDAPEVTDAVDTVATAKPIAERATH